MLFYAWSWFLWELLGLISRAVSYILGVGKLLTPKKEVELQQWAKTHPTDPRTSILILTLEPTQEQGTGGKVLGDLSM